ncbi:ricin-type beta-trefoil lectin domain protein [Streptomyces griseoluteus]
MGDALRLGGPGMYDFAQSALNQTPQKLRELATLDGAFDGPLHQAHVKDESDWKANWTRLDARRPAWEKPLDGLETPGGFTNTEFHWVPGVHEGDDFYEQTGLGKWAGGPDWTQEFDFYDPTTTPDPATQNAVKALGAPLYGTTPPYDPDLTTEERDRQYYERRAFEELTRSSRAQSADDARIFLASGGFPRTAPAPGSTEYRIAVEDLKTRFASCTWRDPIDPNKALRGVEDTAATEWQQEVASQATQRNQILDANRNATKALAKGAEAMAEMLGQSWIADHLTRWQDYWSAGGVGWIGDGQTAIQVEGAAGKCLDVQGGGTANGTPVQIYTCNDGSPQRWQLIGYKGGLSLLNIKSQKCLDVQGAKNANGTKIQIWTCNSSEGQQWKFNVRAAGELRNVATDKCLDLSTFDNSTDSRLWTCDGSSRQKFRVVPKSHNGTEDLSYPTSAQFTKAQQGISAARAAAAAQLTVLKAQLGSAQAAATTSAAAEKAAYAVADAAGAPRGRGLLVGQQKAQVTQGAAAALTALVKAGTTAEAATRASAGDSATIAQRALAQAAQSKVEFRAQAAYTAELQAKAAADAAKTHRDNAKKDKETAEAKLAEALTAESDAKAAAADAHAKRLKAEAEEATAKKEKETAEAKQAEAAQHQQNAEAEARTAVGAKSRAEAAESTAVARKNDAEAARDRAQDLRDDAWDAEQKADAARARADAKEAFAEAHESDSSAGEARTAADAASSYADDAEAAAGRARSEADAATQAAADADAAADRAEAAAKRARAAADGAEAAKLKADAAVRTATSAAADAIVASKHAASEANLAVEAADRAAAQAKTAKAHADVARTEAANAVAASAKAAGFAYVTAQTAVDAGNAAAQVAAPANDAIQLGSPYVTTDSAAALVVLTGQASKTIAEQQKAVADAHAKNAAAEADAAKNLADQAQGDAKAAYQHAANAARYAAQARGYAKEALDYATSAASAAAKAQQSLARTVEYDRQATKDAAAADSAAGRAEGFAAQARDSADQAALDASAARAAAAEAERAAEDARAAATRADEAATAAEEAAKDAQKAAESAQQAAESAERKQANQQVSTGAGTGIGGTFYVVDEDSVKVTDASQDKPCEIPPGFGTSCTVTFSYTFDVTVDFYVCTNPDVPATVSGCPSSDTVHLGSQTYNGLTKKITRTFTQGDILKGLLQTYLQVGKAVLVQDFADCWHGSAAGCAWAASNFIPGKTLGKVVEGIRALDAAMRTGIGVREAFVALKALDVNPATLARIENTVDTYEDLVTLCRTNSFPGDTRVLMADGSRKAIRDVHVGEAVLATDPRTGRSAAQPVTDTFRHDTTQLVDIHVAGGVLTSTAGHRFYVEGRGWTLVSDLRVGDSLRTPDGVRHRVDGLRDRAGLAPSEVYDLTVDGFHSFYVGTSGDRSQDVLVHNCTNIVGDEDIEGAHTLSQHVRPSDDRMADMAVKKGTATKWTDQATAVGAVDQAMTDWIKVPGNAKTLESWRIKQAQRVGKGIGFDPRKDLLTIRVPVDGYGPSLGKKWVKNGPQGVPAGNVVHIELKFVKGHAKPRTWVVYTSFPE